MDIRIPFGDHRFPSMLLSIVVPVRGETLNLTIMAKVMGAVLETEHEILAVYDDATDPSAPVADELQRASANVRGVLNALGPGVANAFRAGVDAARGEYVVTFVADEIVPILAIDDMRALMDEGCDFVNGTRYGYGGGRVGGSLSGKILSRLANRTFSLLTASPLTDCTSGVKMFRRSQFAELTANAQESGWGFAFEMAINAQLLGYRLGEVPAISVDRMFGGTSTFQLVPWVIDYLKIYALGIRRLPPRPFGRKPEVRVRIPGNIAGAHG